MRKLALKQSAQSLVEYVVLLALIGIIAITVISGIGQRSRGRVAQANEALEEASIASRTGKPPGPGVAGQPRK